MYTDFFPGFMFSLLKSLFRKKQAKAMSAENGIASAVVPKKITNAQTVCNERNEKGKLCNGYIKQLNTAGQPSEVHLRGEDVLYKCQMCGALYMGPPQGHLRDREKMSRTVEDELSAILNKFGGTLPEFARNERGTLVQVNPPLEQGHASPEAKPKVEPAQAGKPAQTAQTAKPAQPAKAAAPVSDSSASADEKRPEAEAQAAKGQASAAPLNPAAAEVAREESGEKA
jgi:hypothetical protein